MKSIFVLTCLVLLCLLTGFAGSMATAQSISDWYPNLSKPPLTPPDWVFAPVWTTLFVVMGIAAWLVWKQESGRRGGAYLAFGLQLGLNLLWSILFFGFESPGLALIEILVLWIAILATLVLFRRHSPTAALLFVPYLAWVSFATYLNGGIWLLNSLNSSAT